MIDHSRKRFLIADHTKFSSNASVLIAGLSVVDTIITDKPLPPTWEAECINKKNSFRVFVSCLSKRRLIMQNFNYHNPAKIIFGKDSEKEVQALLHDLNVHSLLLVYSGDFIKTLGIFDTVKDACEKENIVFFENGSVVPNPKIELVRQLTALGKEKNIDFILAVGGGSSIDTAKAVATGIPYDGDVWDFFSKERPLFVLLFLWALSAPFLQAGAKLPTVPLFQTDFTSLELKVTSSFHAFPL